MTTAVDTNVITALWDSNDTLNQRAQVALDQALERGSLVVAAPVFAELLALPGRSESFLETFFRESGVAVDWVLSEAVWRRAGQAFQSYVARRRELPSRMPRRILADFVIGAHAFENGFELLTLDTGVYRAAFPRLAISTF